MTTPLLRYLVLCLALVIAPRIARADDVADAKTFISTQVKAIKGGDLAGVKAGMSKRQRDKITQAMIDKAKAQTEKLTIDDLVAKVEAGKDSLKIKMKSGRTLTTLIKEDGAWRADTIWFK
jgi:hypothetical protein